MAEVIDLTKHPLYKKHVNQDTWPYIPFTEQAQSVEQVRDSDLIAVSLLTTDDLVQELLTQSAVGRGLRQIPKDMIIIELATRLESYSNILEEVLNRNDSKE